MAYLAPTIWGMFIPAFGRVGAIRMTFTLMAAVAFICMLVPVFCIREKDYVDTVPAKESAFGSLTATFKNGNFASLWHLIFSTGSHLPCFRQVFHFLSPVF